MLSSYLAIRNDNKNAWQSLVADWSFIAGLFVLMAAVLSAVIDL